MYLVSSPECTLTRIFFSSRARRERDVPRLWLRARYDDDGASGGGREWPPGWFKISNSEREDVLDGWPASSSSSEMGRGR